MKNSVPVWMWINMGLNQDNLGYWDNMQSYNIYEIQGNFSKEKSGELFRAAIGEKLSGMSAGDLIMFWYKKVVWTWTEGTYQIDTVCIGNPESSGQSGMGAAAYCYTTFATDLFKGDSVCRRGLLWILYAENFLMYCFIAERLAGGIRKKRYAETLPILVILGFIGFYLIWEIKSRYIYPVYPLLIILSYMGFKDAHDAVVKKLLLKRGREK